MAMAERFVLVVSVVVVLCLSLCEVGEASTLGWYGDGGLKGDGEALLAFKDGVEDPEGVLESWEFVRSPCSWRGVECGGVGEGAVRVVGLELMDAGLRGSVSAKLGELSELEVLNLMGNRLEGSVPEELCDCKRLLVVNLNRNGLVGLLPDGILSRLPNLMEFSASDNKLSGRLLSLIAKPVPGYGVCGSLKVLDLSRNRFTGDLPRDLRLCSDLVEIRLGSNYLINAIPGVFGELRNLEVLHLEDNILSFQLPEELKRCTKLRVLNVANNFLDGEIPPSFVKLRELKVFDVRRNQLSGHIPQDGRWIRRASLFEGNDGLCGSPLQPCKGKYSLQAGTSYAYSVFSKAAERLRNSVRKSSTQPNTRQGLRRSLLSTSSRRRSTAARWGLGIAVGLVSGAAAATIIALLTRAVMKCYSSKEDLKKPIIFNKKITPNMLAFLDKDDALAGYTLLGEGGNGKVYQVPLQEDIVVAIKCVHNHTSDEEDQTISHDAKQIRAELETLGFIRHRNLVQLLAYIFKSDSHLLIYEFIPGGSLQDALHQMALGTLDLTWPERHRILCGVAQGLAYLHNESLGSSIVHRDLKPANILLDDGYEAKLGDFGLAAIVPLKATHATTDVLAGTIGFIAPEYHQTMRYSQKSDVFSFGVVIAQLVTARSPTDQFVVENGGSIGQWLHKCLQSNNGVDAIDPALQGSGYETEIQLAMKIAVFCTNQEPQQRPKSTEVLKMLLQIRNPEPGTPGDNLSLDSQGSDTPILTSSGPLRFPDSTSTTQSY
ncbi:hypothetical protein KC19_6G140700 [Ceratodon purpureus]|uniref:Protein kinase domain-containing protein n=1 Tax=Ceratodon purpureus TaxID=3225 RepID=A0A8T0HE92_CERPU|nr:hypothetical protein KC19_6G140700 [Ceratodon purpureus]